MKVFLLALAGFIFTPQEAVFSQSMNITEKKPQPKVIQFDPGSIQYQELFDGENDTVVFYSGVVTLLPGDSGEIHSTEIYEELIITLEGEGQLMIDGFKELSLKFGTVAFVPPNTEHHTVNRGKDNFKYVYVATKAK